MKYLPLEMDAPLHELEIVAPEGRESVAVIRGLTDDYDHWSDFRTALYKLKEAGRTGLVVDFSGIKASRASNFGVLYGVLEIGAQMEGRYVGIASEELETEYPQLWGDIGVRLHETIDEAVEAFS